MTENKQHLPHGWEEKRVREVLAHYETQTEEEAITEDEQAFVGEDRAVMEVPIELVPAIRAILAQCERLGGYPSGGTVVVLAPDVAEVFPDSESVNEALRALIKVARQSVEKAVA